MSDIVVVVVVVVVVTDDDDHVEMVVAMMMLLLLLLHSFIRQHTWLLCFCRLQKNNNNTALGRLFFLLVWVGVVSSHI